MNISSKKLRFDVNFGTKGLEISGTSINGDNENSFGATLNLRSLCVDFEYSSAIVWDNTTAGTYTTIGVNVLFFVAAFVKVPIG